MSNYKSKKEARIRRSKKTRAKISELSVPRLTVFRSPRHIYAQLIGPSGSEVIASASTLDSSVKTGLNGTGNVAAATVVGNMIAQKAKEAGITKIAFDRSGYKYHGRIKALAEAARQGGLDF